MKKENLHLYTVMHLQKDHIDEVCADIKSQIQNGVATCPIFMFKLAPEGTPPVDRAKIFCDIYREYKTRLDKMGIKNGILVQCSIGHDYVIPEMFPFQRYVNFRDGDERNVVCPYDEDFRDYIRDAFYKIASCHPDCIMVDDDFRLMFRYGGGCACPLHMNRFNELANTALTREELWEIVSGDDERKEEYTDIMLKTQMESLVETAKVMRAGIDAVDKTIPGSFCCCGNNAEFAAEVAEVLAGEGNPTMVRVNNGKYLCANPREFSAVFHRAAQQAAMMKNKVDIILDETDTCPQNRYSTSATVLHAHFTGCLLEGLNGAKQWLTRGAYEPESGIAYRKKLSQNRGFYEEIASIVPTLKWRGCRMPLAKTPQHKFGPLYYENPIEHDGWSQYVLERMGLPIYFGTDMGGITFMQGEQDSFYTDEEIKEFLSGPVVLASDTAKRLIERGFIEHIGVDVRDWNGAQPMGERIVKSGNKTKVQPCAKELVPLSDKTVAETFVYYSLGDKAEDLFPGVTTYKNDLGGTVAVYSGTPVAPFDLGGIFAFLTQSRKAQFIDLFSRMGELPVYCKGDDEVYLKVADMPDGNTFCAIFDISLDEIENINLVSEKEIKGVKKLLHDGTWQSVGFEKAKDSYVIKTTATTLNPVILILEH